MTYAWRPRGLAPAEHERLDAATEAASTARAAVGIVERAMAELRALPAMRLDERCAHCPHDLADDLAGWLAGFRQTEGAALRAAGAA